MGLILYIHAPALLRLRVQVQPPEAPHRIVRGLQCNHRNMFQSFPIWEMQMWRGAAHCAAQRRYQQPIRARRRNPNTRVRHGGCECSQQDPVGEKRPVQSGPIYRSCNTRVRTYLPCCLQMQNSPPTFRSDGSTWTSQDLSFTPYWGA